MKHYIEICWANNEKSRIKVDIMVQSIIIVKVAQKNTKKVSFTKKRLEMKKKEKNACILQANCIK